PSPPRTERDREAGCGRAHSVLARLRQSSPAVTQVLDSGAVLAGCGTRRDKTLCARPLWTRQAVRGCDGSLLTKSGPRPRAQCLGAAQTVLAGRDTSVRFGRRCW